MMPRRVAGDQIQRGNPFGTLFVIVVVENDQPICFRQHQDMACCLIQRVTGVILLNLDVHQITEFDIGSESSYEVSRRAINEIYIVEVTYHLAENRRRSRQYRRETAQSGDDVIPNTGKSLCVSAFAQPDITITTNIPPNIGKVRCGRRVVLVADSFNCRRVL